MAERLGDSWPERLEPGNLLGYDWPTWADGGVWRLVKDQDFIVTTKAFTMAGRQWARRNGYEWRSRMGGFVVWVQLVKIPEPEAEIVIDPYDDEPVGGWPEGFR